MLMLTASREGLMTIYQPFAFEYGAPLYVADGRLGYQEEGCAPLTGFVKAQLKSVGNGGKLQGCMWQENDGIGTMVVVDELDIFFPASPLLLRLNSTYWNWSQNQNGAKSDLDLENCRTRDCAYGQPDFTAQPEWQYICRLQLAGLTFGTNRDNWLLFRLGTFDMLAINPTTIEIGLEIRPDPNTGEDLLWIYRLGPDLQIEFLNGFECS